MKIGGRPEPVSAAIGWDDLRLGAICQTNPEIAGSRRNNFRVSVTPMNNGGKALTEVGAYTATELIQTLNTVI